MNLSINSGPKVSPMVYVAWKHRCPPLTRLWKAPSGNFLRSTFIEHKGTATINPEGEPQSTWSGLIDRGIVVLTNIQSRTVDKWPWPSVNPWTIINNEGFLHHPCIFHRHTLRSKFDLKLTGRFEPSWHTNPSHLYTGQHRWYRQISYPVDRRWVWR